MNFDIIALAFLMIFLGPSQSWSRRISFALLKLAIPTYDSTTKYYNAHGDISQVVFANELVSNSDPCVAFVDKAAATIVMLSCKTDYASIRAPAPRSFIDHIMPSNISCMVGGYGPDSVFVRCRLNRFIEMHRLKFGESPSLIASCTAFASICTPFLHPSNREPENELEQNIIISRPLAVCGFFGHVSGTLSEPLLLLMCVDISGNIREGSIFHIGLSKSQSGELTRVIAQLSASAKDFSCISTFESSTQMPLQRYSAVIHSLKQMFGSSCNVEMCCLSPNQRIYEKA